MGVKVVYVVASSGNDVYADMTLVSLLSVRLSNPGAKVVIVCDKVSAEVIKKEKHKILDICDEFICVDTPNGSNTFRNRWIKTQICKYVTGDFLFLDSDTLVRKSLAELLKIVTNLGVVYDTNAVLPPQYDVTSTSVAKKMNWNDNLYEFYNAGVFFMRNNSAVRNFFECWHSLWLSGVKSEEFFFDQPSFNEAIRLNSHIINALDQKYNLQIKPNWKNSDKGIIWHFWYSATEKYDGYYELVERSKYFSTKSLASNVQHAINQPFHWRNNDFIAHKLLKKINQQGFYSTSEYLWLNGHRITSCRFIIGSLREKLKLLFA